MIRKIADIDSNLVIGIDASNIRAGGGVTHLAQMLTAAVLPAAGIRHVIVWGGKATLARLPDQDWLSKVHIGWLDWSLPFRILWQQFFLPQTAMRASCSALFSPGGSVPIIARIPCVTMSQNMLPFEPRERRRFGLCSWMYWKLLGLRWIQSHSLQRAAGVIFLTRYARDTLRAQVAINCDTIIPHGVETRFFLEMRKQRKVSEFSDINPFRVLYVSIIDVYKHQDMVAIAVAQLRSRRLPVSVDFIGPAYAPALTRLKDKIRQLDDHHHFLNHRGPIAFGQLHVAYAEADAFVFASSCENLPNILLEAMAAGLPIACSNREPMPEILGDAGVYYDPEQPEEIASALERLFLDHTLRTQLAMHAQERAREYSWQRCASDTFSFIEGIVRKQSVH